MGRIGRVGSGGVDHHDHLLRHLGELWNIVDCIQEVVYQIERV